MARISKILWENGFKIYFAFCLLAFTLLILLINVTRVFAADIPAEPVVAPVKTVQVAQAQNILPKNFYHWTLASDSKAQETYMEFRGNKMFFKVNF